MHARALAPPASLRSTVLSRGGLNKKKNAARGAKYLLVVNQLLHELESHDWLSHEAFPASAE